MNYLVWIAKAGVLPRFLLRIFLFLPAALALLARRKRVTLVFDAMGTFLSLWYPKVKKILPLGVFLVLFSPYLRANPPKTIILAVGEHKEIPTQQISTYTIGNKAILSHKRLAEGKKLLIRGKALGFSELILWHKGKKPKTKEHYHFYVIDKSRQKKIIALLETIRATGVNATLLGPVVIVSGAIENEETHALISKIRKKNPKDIHIKAKFAPKYYRKLLGKIYKKLYDEYVDHFNCQINNMDIVCSYPEGDGPSESLQNFLREKYFIKFIPLANKWKNNYLLRIKLIQMEKRDGSEINLGLSQLTANLKDLFEGGVSELVAQNKLILSKKDISISTMAEPQIVIRPGGTGTIQVGKEVLFQANDKDNDSKVVTVWKFSGMRIKFSLKKHKGRLSLKYNAEFTGARRNSIGGNKGSSSVFITPKRPIKIFETTFKSTGQAYSRIPLIHHIPIIGRIFQGGYPHSNFKRLVAVAHIEEIHEY